jgi:hypothetical protein
MRAVARGLLYFLTSIFVLFAVVEIKRLLAHEVKHPDAGVAVLAFCAVCAAGCVRGASRLRDNAAPSSQVIRAAKTLGGRVTAAQIVASTRLTYEQATSELDRLCKAGACEAIAGTNLYRFSEFEATPLENS